MDGPNGGITFKAGNEVNGPTQLSALTEQAGLYQAVFRPESNPLPTKRPPGDLGPKYTITYTVPGPSNEVFKIRQDVYPYADPAPVVHTAPGQKIYASETPGGWFQAGPELKETLVSAGLPATISAGDSGGSFPTGIVGLLAATLVLAAATAVVFRRRTRPATAS
jgi:hypothetical protein